jgi:hypothetical protein
MRGIQRDGGNPERWEKPRGIGGIQVSEKADQGVPQRLAANELSLTSWSTCIHN